MFTLRKLPFELEDVKDFISAETCSFHYGKHHQTYVNNLNGLIKDSAYENSSLYEIIKKSDGGLFNNAAQVYNHDFYWDCLGEKGSTPSQELIEAINNDFGSIEEFKKEFLSKSTTLFGSGWCWLVYNGKNLEIIQTSNAQTPISNDLIPVLVVDVWEHAYYVDYRNARPGYLDKFFENINWNFVSKAYEWALKEKLGSINFYINEIHPK